MGILKEQMLMEMELRNFRPNTIYAYTRQMESYTRLFGKAPDLMGELEVRKYLHHLKKVKGVSSSNINIAYCALRFFYVKTLHRDWNVDRIPRPKTEKRLPNILARSELRRLFDSIENLKHRAMLLTSYSGGLRVSETANLKLTDIDSKRMLIRVDQGKGAKDRYTLLSELALEALRDYYLKYRPKVWLFPGRSENEDCAINVSTIQQVFKTAKTKAGIKKPASVHTLRHCFATHLLEDGVDLFTIKDLMGHRSLSTTIKYIHLQRRNLKKIFSPLDNLGGE